MLVLIEEKVIHSYFTEFFFNLGTDFNSYFSEGKNILMLLYIIFLKHGYLRLVNIFSKVFTSIIKLC